MAQDISPGILAQLEALTTGFNQHARLGNLSPDLLAYLASMPAEQADWGLTRGFNTADGRSIRQSGQWANTLGTSPDSQALSFDPSRVNLGGAPIDFMLNTDQSNLAAVFNPDGTFRGYEQRMDDSNYSEFIRALLMMAPAVAGVYGAAAGAGSEAGAVSGMDLAADAAAGSGNNIYTAAEALSGTSGATAGMSGMSGSEGSGGGPGGYGGDGIDWSNWANNELSNSLSGSGYAGADFFAGEAAAAGAGLTPLQKLAAEQAAQKTLEQTQNNGNNDFRTQERGGYQSDPNATTKPATTNGNMSDWDKFLNGVQQFLGNGAGSDPNSWANIASRFLGNNAGGLLGALGGYLDGKDKTITSQTAPWEPAQPYIKGLFNEGADLYGQYKQHPFSPAEQAAYANTGNVLDYINGNAGGLLSGFQANASGANQFSRDNPRRQLIGAGYDPNNPVVPWRPQLLGDFGTGGTGLLRR